MALWEKLVSIDRRWVYLAVAMAVIIPFIFPARFPISIPREARQLFDAVEALPDSSIVMLPFDMYPSTLAETEPMARAALHHLFRKDCRVITMSNVPQGGATIAERVTREMAREYDKVYGVDYVNLGYKANYVAVLQGMGASIENIYPTDNSSTPLSQLPLMDSVNSYADLDFIFVVTDNGVGDYWISIVHAQFHTTLGCGVSAVMAPQYYAYTGSGQIVGMLAGMKGAAAYEILVGKRALAFKGMDIQSLVHFLIIAFVILGNIGFFVTRRRNIGGNSQ